MPRKSKASHPKPPLTSGGKRRKTLLSDAPRALAALAATQVPRDMHGPAMRGAWARGWCDGVRGRKADENPYQRAGSGWQHGMAAEYAAGWVQGKRVARIDMESEGMNHEAYARHAELRDRVHAMLRGEIIGARRAVGR